MIQLLAHKYRKSIACSLSLIFFLEFSIPLYAMRRSGFDFDAWRLEKLRRDLAGRPSLKNPLPVNPVATGSNIRKAATEKKAKNRPARHNQQFIGGPSQPEMSSFKSIGADNMVNLFTGNFSYNIPLLDVGGYPVNIFYNGGIGMEQEASWVGLGWNINPGNINRNMRGVPDDFDGTDMMLQTQKMKANVTWGVNLNADLEFNGLKKMPKFLQSVGVNLGVSFNNYLGPAIDFGIKGGVGFKIADYTKTEKDTKDTLLTASVGVSAGVSANLSSRYGLTLSPNVSLTGTKFLTDKTLSFGLSLGTSYNSRSGIKALQISEQTSFNRAHEWKDGGEGEYRKLEKHGSGNGALIGTSINFARPSYIPAIRMPMSNEAWSGHFQLGGAIWGIYGSAEVEVFKSVSKVAEENVDLLKPLVGYMYYEKAAGNPAAVMDFTRFNDNEVTPRTPVISAPQYTYDVFELQGEGTGGSVRAYRNDYGYVRDNTTRSQDKNISAGVDIGIPGHFGANFNLIKTPSVIGEWTEGNKLRNFLSFANANSNPDRAWEKVYFRNPGETSVLTDQQFAKIGGTDLVRFKLGGYYGSTSIEPTLERFSRDNKLIGTVNLLQPDISKRKKRSQVFSFLTAAEASVVGLDKKIKSYSTTNILNGTNNLVYDSIDRVGSYRKAHHISQINVAESDGKRYVYGIPVYNIVQKDFTFSVGSNAIDDDLVGIQPSEITRSSAHLNNSSSRDGYLQISRMPAYAHSFLLSGILSPDYVDLTGNGITEDDLGEAVKFNYTKTAVPYRWRSPLTEGQQANYNTGNRSNPKDNKGIISYGERETWYLQSIESKTMIALFTLETRADGRNTVDSVGGIDYNNPSLRRLKKIDLYNKADLKKNGIANAKPIKTVNFEYSYRLCARVPGNKDTTEIVNGQNVNAERGKLTLERIYFTYNGKLRSKNEQYLFSYGSTAAENPAYAFNATDRWGTYKPKENNPDQLKNSAYPYSLQKTDAASVTNIRQNAGAWSLKKILLPSGGQLEVEYESDDYAYVQNRRAASMMKIAGFGKAPDGIYSNNLYGVSGLAAAITENDVVYINLPDPCNNRTEVGRKYLDGVQQLAFKLAVVMPKGEYEYVTSYATIADYGVYNSSTIWVRVNLMDGLSPMSLTALEYLKEKLPGQAFPGYEIADGSTLQQVGDMLAGWGNALKNAFRNPILNMRSRGAGKTVLLSKSFVRLNEPTGFKYGGGHRVKKVLLKDNWKAMANKFTAVYGQAYDYTTTEVLPDGSKRTISSGVATYEPAIGNEENPFQTILLVANRLPAGPATYGAIEMPFLDAFFPSPTVGYSKVSVRSIIYDSIPAGRKSRSGVGRQVTEFYTAKDYPVYYNYTSLDPGSDKGSHNSNFTAFFYKYAFDSRSLSQGFLIENNDMHGKMKSQSSYGEKDTATRINYTQYFYRNTGAKGLNEKFDFAYGDQGGKVEQGNMGIDIELMTDTREMKINGSSLEIQAQVELYPVILPVWLPFIWPVFGESESIYRAVTTTKVINYHSVLDSVVVIDKGSQVSKRDMVYDAETGQVLVTRTNNEFDKPVYKTTYPAYWAYSGMGPAYKNIDLNFSGVGFKDGKIISGVSSTEISNLFESGDELYLSFPGSTPSDNCGAKLEAQSVNRLWAFDQNKNTSSLKNPNPDFIFMDSAGRLYTKKDVSFRIIRSGRRNLLADPVATAITLADPIDRSSTPTLRINNNSNTVSATATEFREKWQIDNETINKLSTVFDNATCSFKEVIDCNGYLEKRINPYTKGLLGSFITNRKLVFLADRKETNPATPTNLPRNGTFDNFKLYWDFSAGSSLVPDLSSNQWVSSEEVTRINSLGRQLETRNALNIYTGAQYGYKKTLPIAIADNSRYHEMLYAGFEDEYFNGNINAVQENPCLEKHISLANMPNAVLTNMDSISMNAHTGKYALKVNGNSTATKTIPIKSSISEDFSFVFDKDTTKSLYAIGLNIGTIRKSPSTLVLDTSIYPNASSGNEAMFLRVRQSRPTQTSTSVSYAYDIDAFNYIEVLQDRVYNITRKVMEYRQTSSTFADMLFRITSLSGVQVPITYISTSFDDKLFSCCLPKGIYRIDYSIHADYYYSCSGSGCTWELPGVEYSLIFDDFKPGYKSPSTQNGCIFTKPAYGTGSMLNPLFSFPAGKRMLFSSWVKDPCINSTTGLPCNSVNITFNNGSSISQPFRPSGPVIEGWQKIEGEFTAPPGVTSMDLKFVNGSGVPIYYDDIRIHPFNANMKSYVYDPVTLRLIAELDPNNYGTFYEYDEEGTLVRTKAETKEGIKTIQETRSSKQKNINSIQ